jgi:hypothetical protein
MELVVTLALTAIVSAALGSVLLTHMRVTRIVAARVAAANAVRLALHVIPAELRLARPATDIRSLAPDSLAARLPRVTGTVCARAGSQLWISASGMREPDPAKDSMLLLSGTGEVAAALSGLAEDPGGCPERSGLTTYRVDAPADSVAGAAVLIFESGTYYARERAFRFRVGAEGRQPLTEEVFSNVGAAFVLRPDSSGPALSIRLVPRADFGRTLARAANLSFGFPNAVRSP